MDGKTEGICRKGVIEGSEAYLQKWEDFLSNILQILHFFVISYGLFVFDGIFALLMSFVTGLSPYREKGTKKTDLE